MCRAQYRPGAPGVTRRRSWWPALAVVAALILPACASETPDATGDTPASEADAALPSQQDQMAMLTELQSIDQALTPIRERAMEDPAMQAREQEIVARVEASMEAASPGIGERRTRFDSLLNEFGAAQQAGDQATAQSLATELQSLETLLQQAQASALQEEEIAAMLAAFREELFAKMRAIDPAADSLIDRGDALSEKLQAAAGGNGGL